jgi:hypothetical protein
MVIWSKSHSFGELMKRADAAISVQWELAFGLEPMHQREAVPPALRFIELIRPLGNPDVPVNRRDRPGFAI